MSIYRVTKTGDEYRAMASASSKSSADSFERCDTDGFMSQWASDQMSRVYRALADLADGGGMADIRVLCDLDGNEVNAKPIKGKFGTCWALLDDDGNITGFAPWNPKRESTLTKRGYREEYRSLPCVVETHSSKGSYSIGIGYTPEKWLGGRDE